MVLNDIKKQMTKINKSIKKAKELRTLIGIKNMVSDEESTQLLKAELLLNRKKIKEEIKKLCDLADKKEEEKI